MRSLAPLVTLLALACGPKAPPSAATADTAARSPRPMPEALPTPDFTVPEASTHTLSNGMQVIIAENHEVPLWNLRMAFSVGGFADPVGKHGLASATFDMMNEGAGDLDAAGISRELKRLASSISSGASTDGAEIGASGIKRNIEPTLDLLAKVLLEPTFPKADWEHSQTQRIAGIAASRTNPTRMAGRVFNGLLYSKGYLASVSTPETVKAISTADMKRFYGQYVGPSNAIILVGGDVTPDEVLPLLEARFGTWAPKGIKSAKPKPSPALPETPTMYLLHSPDAAQSVVRAFTLVPNRLADDYFGLKMGVTVLGGSFVARMNMNLREDKGYTYGARCGISHRFGPSIASCSSSVQSDKTGPSLVEIKKEIAEILSTRPATADELQTFQDSEVNGYPGRFETVGALLHDRVTNWRYGLPDDWTERYLPSVQGVTVDQANAALRSHWKPEATSWLVVGDKAQILAELEAFGLPIVEIDADGNNLGG